MNVDTDTQWAYWDGVRILDPRPYELYLIKPSIYSRAGGSTISYVHSYQVRNTLLRINYLTCLVSTMASSGFGPYHGMSLEDAQA